jgi:hypothetical protein
LSGGGASIYSSVPFLKWFGVSVNEILLKKVAILTEREVSRSPNLPRFCTAMTKLDAKVPNEIKNIMLNMNQFIRGMKVEVVGISSLTYGSMYLQMRFLLEWV